MDYPAEFPTNPKVDAIIADITQLMNEAEQMLAESTSHHAEPQVALLQGAHPGSVKESFEVLCTSAGQAVAERAQRTDRAIRANPYLSIVIALGGGVLFGLAIARRHA